MAERRMLSSKIICSDAFTEMPFSAQALYVQLVMEADDDGFLNNAKRIAGSIEATADDLGILLEKRFLLGFKNRVVVIKHWRIHNQIRKDRYTPTQYQEEYDSLVIKPDGAYTEKVREEVVDNLATIWQPNATETATQVRLGKDSIGKVNIDNTVRSDPDESEHEVKMPSKADIDSFFESLWSLYPVKKGKAQVSESKRKNLYAVGFEKMQRAIDRYLKELERDAAWRKPQNGSTFFNSGYVDYLDENFVPDQSKQGGKKEYLPGWFESKMGDAEREAIQRALTESEQAEADQLRRELQASFGSKGGG